MDVYEMMDNALDDAKAHKYASAQIIALVAIAKAITMVALTIQRKRIT